MTTREESIREVLTGHVGDAMDNQTAVLLCSCEIMPGHALDTIDDWVGHVASLIDFILEP